METFVLEPQPSHISELTSPTAASNTPAAPQPAEMERLLGFGTYDYDVQAGVGVWSEGIYGLFEYPPGERPVITLELFLNHLPPEQAGAKQRQLAESIRMRQVEYTDECTILTAAGNRRRIQISGRRLYDPAGRPLRYVGLIRAAGEASEKEKEAEQLSRYVSELKRSNRELEEFAYIASHDLQEPLRKISTFCGRLFARYHDQLDREGGQYLDRILASTDSMRALIDNLLEYSRIARGEEPLQPTRLDVLLLGVQGDLELTIEETGTRIDVGPLPMVMGHMPQLMQLFTNLISNAIKFRRADVVPRIHIQSAPATAEMVQLSGLDSSQPYYAIAIEDNGIGFEPEYAERIFGAFQRLHSKAEYPGSGIGLAICRKIAERHGGALTASSNPGEGACFQLLLPRTDFPTSSRPLTSPYRPA